MKVLRIQARGLPLLPHGMDVCLYGQQRVNEKDKEIERLLALNKELRNEIKYFS